MKGRIHVGRCCCPDKPTEPPTPEPPPSTCTVQGPDSVNVDLQLGGPISTTAFNPHPGYPTSLNKTQGNKVIGARHSCLYTGGGDVGVVHRYMSLSWNVNQSNLVIACSGQFRSDAGPETFRVTDPINGETDLGYYDDGGTGPGRLLELELDMTAITATEETWRGVVKRNGVEFWAVNWNVPRFNTERCGWDASMTTSGGVTGTWNVTVQQSLIYADYEPS